MVPWIFTPYLMFPFDLNIRLISKLKKGTGSSWFTMLHNIEKFVEIYDYDAIKSYGQMYRHNTRLRQCQYFENVMNNTSALTFKKTSHTGNFFLSVTLQFINKIICNYKLTFTYLFDIPGLYSRLLKLGIKILNVVLISV